MSNYKCTICQNSHKYEDLHTKVAILNEQLFNILQNEVSTYKVDGPITIKMNLVKGKVELYNVCENCLDNDVFKYTNQLYNQHNVSIEVANESNMKGTIAINEDLNFNNCYCCDKPTDSDKERNTVLYISDSLLSLLKSKPNLFYEKEVEEIKNILSENSLLVNACNNCVETEILPKQKVLEDYGVVLSSFENFNNEFNSFEGYDYFDDFNDFDSDSEEDEDDSLIEEFGEDLLSEDNIAKFKENMIFGRDKEVDSLINILSKRDKNNPIILGEPGVGKTSIVHKLCLRIHEGEVPTNLKDVKIYEVKISNLVAGTRFRGDLEEKMNQFLESIKDRKDIIIFFDEIQQLVGAGSTSSDSINVKDILKPALSKGEITCIGATTFDEYTKSIETDAALNRRFQPVKVDEPTNEETLQLLKAVKKKYENHHSIKIGDKLLEEVVTLSKRYVPNRFLPDKALDLLDQAGALLKVKNDTVAIKQYIDHNNSMIKKIKNKEFESEEDKISLIKDFQKMNRVLQKDITLSLSYIHDVLKDWTGIDVSKLDSKESVEIIANVDEILKEKVIGQEKATDVVAEYIQKSKVGLQSPNRPLGVYLLVGPTGTGKTELAKVTNELLVGNKEIIRFDLSEYSEKHEAAKLIGAPPGYIGYEEGGLLTESVKRNPYSVILLDEIEKAHPEVLNVLLQVFDEGHLTDGKGTKVDFKNTMIFLTSNLIISTKETESKNIGFSSQVDKSEENESVDNKAMLKVLREKGLRPELLNRIDEILLFEELSEKAIEGIANKKLKEKVNEISTYNQYIESCTYDQSVISFLVKKGYNKEYGARPLNRAIEKYISNSLTHFLIKEKVFNKKRKVKCHITVKENNVVVEKI